MKGMDLYPQAPPPRGPVPTLPPGYSRNKWVWIEARREWCRITYQRGDQILYDPTPYAERSAAPLKVQASARWVLNIAIVSGIAVLIMQYLAIYDNTSLIGMLSGFLLLLAYPVLALTAFGWVVLFAASAAGSRSEVGPPPPPDFAAAAVDQQRVHDTGGIMDDEEFEAARKGEVVDRHKIH